MKEKKKRKIELLD